jgi:two-component system NtrC family sensor kinase
VRQRDKAGGKAAKGRRRETVAPKRRNTAKVARRRKPSAVDANEKIELLTRERDEALEQQTATSEVLSIIRRSPADAQPVFDAIVQSAARLCGAIFSVVYLCDGDRLRIAATKNFTPEATGQLQQRQDLKRPDRSHAGGRAVLDGAIIHIHDVLADSEYSREFALAGGWRAVLAVPLLRDGIPMGALSVGKVEPTPFSDRQIKLLSTFADQAVIAIENVRLFDDVQKRTDDLSEALEQQTATADVLKVISSSPGELSPVFQAMLANATRICEASYGVMFIREGTGFRTAAIHNLPRALAEERRRAELIEPFPDDPLARLAATKQKVHIPDARTEAAYKKGFVPFVALVDDGGARTLLVMPLLREDELIGAFAIYRQEVRPFTNKQIALVQNFASQAVIAIENTRLLNELRESLDQQIATADVLKVISTSQGELDAVFQAMLANAVRLCGSSYGALWLREGDEFRNAAFHGELPQAYTDAAQWRVGTLFKPSPDLPISQAAKTGKPFQITDIRMAQAYQDRHPLAVSAVDVAGILAILAVPLVRDGVATGDIVVYRKVPGVFSDKQIEFVSNFAAQAVIAIENARLLNELRESLQQQTATSDVLRVISSSPGELEAVFQVMLENAVRVCDAKFGVLFRTEGDAVRCVAMHGAPESFVEERRRNPVIRPAPATTLGRALATKQPVQIADILNEPQYFDVPSGYSGAQIAKLAGARTVLAVPMLKDAELVGAIIIYRQEVRPFTDKQIGLVQNFTAQAVIAIENARLLNELRESLQQQTATADVLKVISRSTFDLKTVLNTLVESAARLCDADMASINRENGAAYQQVANYGHSPELQAYMDRHPIPAGRGSVVGRTVMQGKIIHIPDVLADPDYKMTGAATLGGIHTMLGVPLLREGTPIGVIVLQRKAVRPFTEKQIELVETFADQAVIAIENVRLFESVEARTRELAKSLEDLRTAQDRLVQTEKLASLGQLTAGIAHEIKNPLNFVNNFSAISVELIDELRQALAGANLDNRLRAQISEIADTLQGNLDKVVQHGKRADTIVKNMLLHSRQGSGEHRPVDINAIVEESLNLAYHGARAEKQGFNITLERSFDPAAGEVDLFPQEITRVLLNLISNGFYAATKRKAHADDNRYKPTLAATTKNLGDSVEIRIRDNGAGIPPEVKEKMFNPFFTTKPVGEGTGLGLSISHDIIVKQHGGSIEVDTQQGEFTEFRIVLPRGAATIAKSGERP